MYILIDNYDSFTHNLFHLFGLCGQVPIVERNDKRAARIIIQERPKAVIISPGPGHPKSAGMCNDLVRGCAENNIPVLGVCLGHQVIGHTFGAKVVKNHEIMHGKTSPIEHSGSGIFSNCKNPLLVTRYHSLIVQKDTLPNFLRITANTKDGTIMGLEHKEKPIFGVQFHPESIASEQGKQLIANFIEIVEMGGFQTV